RARGGPTQIWAEEGHSSIALEQVDYKRVLEREHEGEAPADRASDDELWRSIVSSIIVGQETTLLDEAAQKRLLEIAGNPLEIGMLATAVMAPKCAMDGSPMISAQAAAVLAAFRHLTGIVGVMSPERMPEVMGNLATAAAALDPHV